MKRILIRSLTAALAAVLLLTAVSCDTDEGGIETVPQKETTPPPIPLPKRTLTKPSTLPCRIGRGTW